MIFVYPSCPIFAGTRDVRSIDFNEDFQFMEAAKINTISRETFPYYRA